MNYQNLIEYFDRIGMARGTQRPHSLFMQSGGQNWVLYIRDDTYTDARSLAIVRAAHLIKVAADLPSDLNGWRIGAGPKVGCYLHMHPVSGFTLATVPGAMSEIGASKLDHVALKYLGDDDETGDVASRHPGRNRGRVGMRID